MEIGRNQGGHDSLFINRATSSQLATLLAPDVPYVWILGHMPNRTVQWWKTEVPVNPNHALCAQVRMLTYDMQLRTNEFLARASSFDNHGLVLIQATKEMPDTLDLSRIPEAQQDTVLIGNGGFM